MPPRQIKAICWTGYHGNRLWGSFFIAKLTIRAIAVEKGVKSGVHRYIMVTKGHAAMTTGLALKPKMKVKHEAMIVARKSYFAVGALMRK